MKKLIITLIVAIQSFILVSGITVFHYKEGEHFKCMREYIKFSKLKKKGDCKLYILNKPLNPVLVKNLERYGFKYLFYCRRRNSSRKKPSDLYKDK